MSLPLTRRIARAALLVGAAAAPLVGAGAASAAELPQAADLGGLTSLDKTADLSHTVDGVTKKAGAVASVQQALPDPGKTLSDTANTATPVAKKAAVQTAGALKGATSGVTKAAKGSDKAGPLGALPVSQLPVGQLPLAGGLPIGG
ncbi:ATP-binding protein [Streptomyces sp. NPDC059373]